MEILIKKGDKKAIKKYFPKFQSILMQVAKKGVVKKTASRKFLKHKKNFLKKQFKVVKSLAYLVSKTKI